MNELLLTNTLAGPQVLTYPNILPGSMSRRMIHHDNKLYVVGERKSSSTSTLAQFDLETLQWTYFDYHFNRKHYFYEENFVNLGDIFYVLKMKSRTQLDFYEIDTITGTIVEKVITDVPNGLSTANPPHWVTDGNLIYWFPGNLLAFNSPNRFLVAHNPVNGGLTRRNISANAYSSLYGTGSFFYNGYMTFLGGQAYVGTTNTRLHTRNNLRVSNGNWTETTIPLTPQPIGNLRYFEPFLIGDSVYIFGSAGYVGKDVYKYNLLTNEREVWMSLGELIEGDLIRTASCIVGETIYILGGDVPSLSKYNETFYSFTKE